MNYFGEADRYDGVLSEEEFAEVFGSSATTAVSGNFLFEFDPSVIELADSEERKINIYVFSEMFHELKGIDLRMAFDPEVLEITSVDPGDMFDLYLGEEIDSDNGLVTLSGAGYAGDTGATVRTFMTITVKRISEGPTLLSVLGQDFGDPYEDFTRVVERGLEAFDVYSSLLQIN